MDKFAARERKLAVETMVKAYVSSLFYAFVKSLTDVSFFPGTTRDIAV